MDSLRHPVGTLPPAVYWRRRILVLGVFIAVLALILYACSGSPAKKNSAGPHPTGSGSPSGVSSASASIGGGTPGSGVPSGSGGSQGSQGASPGGPGGSAPGGAAGGSSGAPNSGGSTTAGTGAPGGPQGACQLRLALTAGSPVYADGSQPSFTVAVVNQGTADCTADLGGKSLILTVYSGAERIWSTADCGDGKSDLRAIAPGDVQQIAVTWPRVRSSPGCSGAAGQAGLGTYYAQATLATGTGATATSFASSQQSFQLKPGS